MTIGKKKSKNPIVTTPESPRKAKKDNLCASPRKVNPAASKQTARRGLSPSPVRPKPKFDLNRKASVVTGSSGGQLDNSYLDDMPESPPIFADKIKIKKLGIKKEPISTAKPNDKESMKLEKLKKKRIKKEQEKIKSPKRTPFEVMRDRTTPPREIKPEVEDTKPDMKEPTEVKLSEKAIDSKLKKEFRSLNEVLKSPEPQAEKKKSSKKSKPKRKNKKAEEDDDFKKDGPRITDFFEIRRSNRKTSKQLDDEKDYLWRTLLKEESNDGIEIQDVELKGRGIFSTRPFSKNEFVVEYSGDLIDLDLADLREQTYSEDPKIGSYMYWFNHKGIKWCIDATSESGKYGRLLNHSCKIPNCATKVIDVNGLPRLVIYAKEDIPTGTELLYDYGDRGKLSLELHPWLKL